MASTAALAIVAGAVAPALLVVLWHILRVSWSSSSSSSTTTNKQSWLPVVLLTEFLVLEALVHNVARARDSMELLFETAVRLCSRRRYRYMRTVLLVFSPASPPQACHHSVSELGLAVVSPRYT